MNWNFFQFQHICDRLSSVFFMTKGVYWLSWSILALRYKWPLCWYCKTQSNLLQYMSYNSLMTFATSLCLHVGCRKPLVWRNVLVICSLKKLPTTLVAGSTHVVMLAVSVTAWWDDRLEVTGTEEASKFSPRHCAMHFVFWFWQSVSWFATGCSSFYRQLKSIILT